MKKLSRKVRPIHSIVAILVMAVVMVMLPQRYMALVLNFICIHAIAVTGLDILFGYTGQISFGHAGFYAIGAYGSVLLNMHLGLPVWLTIILGALLSTLVGIVVAFPASKLIKHFLALLTTAFGTIIFIFISITTELTNGFTGISGIPTIKLVGFEFDSAASYFFITSGVLILTMILKSNLIHSRIGRAFIAIRESPTAANGMGINVRYYKIMAFAISAFFVGLAGGLYAHLMGFISPDTFNVATSNMFMTELLFGGIGTIFGPVIGSTILVIMTELFQVLVRYQMLVYALVILLVLFFMPRGVVGLFRYIENRVTSYRNKRLVTKMKDQDGGNN